MPTKHSVFDASFKALEDDDTAGKFEALVSAFGNVDAQGDRVVPGAFKRSIAEWREKGDPLPIIWSHDWGNPNAHIGFADPEDIEETDKGLKVKGQIDLDNPFAKQVYRLLKQRRVREMSFAYDIRDEKRGKDGANDLVDLGLIEAGPTLKGANEATELLGVKSDLEAAAAQCEKAEEKAGRRISRATESELRGAIDTLQAEIDRLRGLLPDEDSDDEKKEVEDDADGKSIDDVNLRARLLIEAAR